MAIDVLDKAAAAEIRRLILPLFRDLGFQRVTSSISERWDGSAERPDRFLRLHLIPEPRRRDLGEPYGVSVELSVFHPAMEHPDCSVRRDPQGRYSPKPAEVFRPRHVLHLWTGDGQPHWRADAGDMARMFGVMRASMCELLVPEIEAVASFAYEVVKHKQLFPLTPDEVRERVCEEQAAVAQEVDLIPDVPFIWTTQKRPAGFFSPDLRFPVATADWGDPVVSALLREAHSLHYLSALADRYLGKPVATEFRQRAGALEAAAGIDLRAETEEEYLSRFGY
ncbi:hypothetical protein [Qipengyuania qiaonensis]|uniref:DUF4304 domain-containing protein n=1 Tax=Qipengyuania qiaonensis TaxID=2867240 RepID=A0ABS7J476_9SPHN|nr:hypothetical protein [Qipengyuania qiaonensis]MBX7482137.1 hypothetical protein [Qipengyuania qiaonensis]